MEKRVCKKCTIEKPLEEFLRAKGEYTYKCLQCNREEGKQRYKNMMSKPDKKELRNGKKRGYGKNWYHTRKQDPEFVKMRKEWHKNEYKTNPIYAMKVRIRRRTASYLRSLGLKKDWKTRQMLGCTYEEFCKHLESLFSEGMTWENRKLWHLDHIIPLSSETTLEGIYKLGHYTNIQPLWGPENISKGNKIL